MLQKDIVLTVNIVEPGLPKAVQRLSKRLGYPLKGLVLVNVSYATHKENRLRDETGLFEEIICDFDNPDELQTVLKPYMEKILVATCRSETAMQAFAKLLPFLPYVHTPAESVLLWSTEKPLMRDRLYTYDPKLVPRYKEVQRRDLFHLSEMVQDFTFPVIVKPGGLAQSLLVDRCDDPQQLAQTLENTFDTIEDIYHREHRTSEPSVLVEEMIEGEMYSTDAYVLPSGEVYCTPLVRVITAKEIGLPGYYSYRHIIPTELPQKDIEAAFAAAKASIRALNLNATTTHIELFHSPTGWKIIEVGARIGGYREDLYREAYGIDHYYNDLLVRLGLEPEIPTEPISHAAGMNIYADEEGTIKSISGLDEARQLDSVVWLEVHAKAGDEAKFAENGGLLIVDGILSNKDPEQLEKDVAKVRELVHINVK